MQALNEANICYDPHSRTPKQGPVFLRQGLGGNFFGSVSPALMPEGRSIFGFRVKGREITGLLVIPTQT